MKQEKIYQRAKNWVAKDLNFNQSGESNVFEITIRVLGGLLSTYNLSKDEMFLEKAVVLADKLLVCFDSPSNIPISSINLLDGVGIPSYNGASTSEATTLQMEFKYLSYLTKDPKYWNAVQLVMKKIFQLQREDGLVPIFISTDTGKFITDEIRLGSRGDSYYEYLIKQYLLTKEQEPILKFEYEKAIQGVRSRLLRLSSPSNLFFVGETTTKKHFSSKMDHLVCFLPGTMAWKATKGEKVTKSTRMLLDPIDLRDLELAEELTRSCVETYFQTQTGLSPEIVFWNENIEAQKSLLDYHTNPKITPIPLKSRSAVPYDDESDLDTRFGNIFETPKIEQDFQIHPQDGHNLLRPETIETLFILYRITGKTIYRTWGWKIFKKLEKYSKLESGGYCSLVYFVNLG
jgi:mannosyl-oligosaccharide alpha-1,2-mannosidase